eukprot:CAMPEP_0194525674 /NCGR_PEP_ID=MMETSP0253-20130528/61209_1 /TAXON_ID=2966 /ORGANISM="Noctiluca scintillans" /LENGTH=361 /DNA_ID=CAMNT_0039370435 /DNA_START=36 /DNA_END=1118 /DNA_ORIENTATION=+
MTTWGDVREQVGYFNQYLFRGERLWGYDFQNHDVRDGDVQARPTDILPPDAFHVGFSSVVRDMWWFGKGTKNHCLRILRIYVAALLALFNTAIQAAFVYALATYVISSQTRTARHYYTEYKSHMTVDGVFNASRFDTLDTDVRDVVCKMPLSQLSLLIPVLLVWTLFVMAEMRECSDFLRRIVWGLPHADHLSEMLLLSNPDESLLYSKHGKRKWCTHDHEVLLVALHPLVRTILFLVFLLPRFIMALILLIAGNMWLIATIDYGECLINCAALEFILDIKRYLYQAVPSRLQREASGFHVIPHTAYESPNCWRFTYSFGFLLFGLCTVWIAISLQTVLPDYGWDLNGPCERYIEEHGIRV